MIRATSEPPPHQIVILDILDLTQNRLARVVALAAAGFLGERVEPQLDLGGQAKGEHVKASNVLYMYSGRLAATTDPDS